MVLKIVSAPGEVVNVDSKGEVCQLKETALIFHPDFIIARLLEGILRTKQKKKTARNEFQDCLLWLKPFKNSN